jgi:hypothetical protein
VATETSANRGYQKPWERSQMARPIIGTNTAARICSFTTKDWDGLGLGGLIGMDGQ